MPKLSIWNAWRLPDSLGAALFLVVLAFAFVPWLPGVSFGTFSVPTLPRSAQQVCRFVGPLMLVGVVLLLVPFLNRRNDTQEEHQAVQKRKKQIESCFTGLERYLLRYADDANFYFAGVCSPLTSVLVPGCMAGNPLWPEFTERDMAGLIADLEQMLPSQNLEPVKTLARIRRDLIDLPHDVSDRELRSREQVIRRAKVLVEDARQALEQIGSGSRPLGEAPPLARRHR